MSYLVPVTPAQFVTNFPAFADGGRYPESQIQMWLDDAYGSMSPSRWGASIDLYAQLRCAHNLSIEGQANRAAQVGGVPGAAQGILSSKGVGPVSAGYDVASATANYGGADYWNQTTYGQRYWRKARLVGMGGMQLMPGC